MLLDLKRFQIKAAELISDRYALFATHPDRPFFKANKPRPFYQALSAITGAGKTPILAEAVAMMCMHMTAQPIVFWMSKAKSVVGQTYNNFIEGGKYSGIVEDFMVVRAGDLNPNLIADGTKPLIVMATTGLFNNKEQSDGKLNIYKRDQDLFGDQSPWERLIARNFDGVRRPLVVVYDEGHNLSDQQTTILAELEPDAYLLASATLQLPANFAKAVRNPVVDWVNECQGSPAPFKAVMALDEAGAVDPHLFVTTTVDSNAVVLAELIKTAIQFDGTTAPMERCLDELHHRLGLIQQDIDARGLDFKPKAIYICKTNINDDGDKDDPDKPFGERHAPPIRIWRYLVEAKKVAPADIAIYADLKFKDGSKPDAVNLFSKGENDFDDFQAGNFQHIIFNLGLQEGWDDPACYLGYVDKSMGSSIRVEQIIGRVLRQYNAKHYDSPLLNSAHFFLRVDKQSVFSDAVAAVKRKLQQDGTAIEIVENYGGADSGADDLAPKPALLAKAVLHHVNKDADGAVASIAKLIAKFPTVDADTADAKGTAHAAKELVDLKNLDTPTVAVDWSPNGETNRVRLRWLINNAIRSRSTGALAVVNLLSQKFDVRVQAQSNAHHWADELAADVVAAYYKQTDLVYESKKPFVFPTVRVPKKAVVFVNGLYGRYAGLNKFELAFAQALDSTGDLWHRNPSSGGFSIPLLSEGDSASFFPDFLAWKGKYVYCLDTKGGHLLTDAVARKLFNIDDAGTVKLLTRFITEGKQSELRGKAIKGGFTVWKTKAGTPTPIHVDSLDDAVKEAMKP
ncbi:type III restriction enzyme [Rhodanobacter sp. K2T2]|uniref:DEAD/DEAH box helicase family protein n=1 Tax=Rhodanobacter sp. K2T2 TaxID=2723085 RepID=UPI0015CDFD60|nr:DEAD/DEAH box helicase family protein [Rhodanobacter sp. K2T2]NYE28544.1 type III restriction enzyme [Rhodanobacter sp. K2T2]